MRIAVVIPALDEAERIGAAVDSARGLEPGGPRVAPAEASAEEAASGAELEVVVVDGGSRDRTAELARAAGARVVPSAAGRARQLEAGWRATGAEVVLFLHADSRLPRGWAPAVREVMDDPRVAGGAFEFGLDASSPGLRVVEWGARLRTRWLRLPYGDQALFARRAVLEAIGGIAPVPIMEDLDLVRALRRCGRLALLPLPVVTSARRYRARGTWRTWWRNAVALGAWRLGIDRERVAAWYRR